MRRCAAVPVLLIVLIISFFCTGSIADGLILPSSNKIIETESFYDNKAVTSVKINEGTLHIGRNAFYGCTKLKDIWIPESVVDIDESALLNCASGLVIHGVVGSAAERYANQHKFAFSPTHDVDISSIMLDRADVTMNIGESIKLNVSFSPAYATNKDVVWESYDTGIATVSDGTVKAKSAGMTTITVSSINTGLKAKCLIYVNPPSPTGISLSMNVPYDEDLEEYLLYVGDTVYAIPNLFPEGATSKIKWSLDHNNRVTIDDHGLITAVGPGIDYIKATTENGLSTDICVQVYNRVESIYFSKSTYQVTTEDGELSVSCSFSPSNNTNREKRYLNWISSNPNVATVKVSRTTSSSNTLIIKGEGVTTITATNDDGISASCDCIVTLPHLDVPEVHKIATLSTGKTKITWYGDETFDGVTYKLYFGASGDTDEYGNQNYALIQTYANVDMDRQCTHTFNKNSAGYKFYLTAEKEGCLSAQSCIYTVEPNLSTGEITPKDALDTPLINTCIPTSSNTARVICDIVNNATDYILYWSQDNANALTRTSISCVPSTDNSQRIFDVTGLSENHTYYFSVQAVSSDNSSVKSNVCAVSMGVNSKPTKVSIQIDKNEMTIGENQQIMAEVLPVSCVQGVNWLSSDESVIKIASDGKISAVGIGEATIRATSVLNNNISDEYTIIVKQRDLSCENKGPTTINYPGNNAIVDFADVNVTWNDVGAYSYIISLRDITSDHLIIYHLDIGEDTSCMLPAAILRSGHKYRVAIGACWDGEAIVSGDIRWKECNFEVKNDSSNASTLTGKVISSEGIPLDGALVYVTIDGIDIATACTSINGIWSLDGIHRGVEYILKYAKAGYSFATEKMITPNQSSITVDTVAAEDSLLDENHILATNTDQISFPPELGYCEFLIISDGNWYIEVDDDIDWLTFSRTTGYGNSWVVVTAAANNEALDSEDRTTTIRIKKGTKPTLRMLKARAATAEAIIASTEVSVIQSSKKSSGYTDERAFKYNVLLNRDEYTGAPVYATDMITLTGNLYIGKDYTYHELTVPGNLTIDAKVQVEKLYVGGNLTVNANGILDCSRNMVGTINGNLTFNSNWPHDDYLKKGTITVGGNVEIKRNFNASGENKMIIKETGTNHVINMWKKGNQKFAKFESEDAIQYLEIKDSFVADDLVLKTDMIKKVYGSTTASGFVLINTTTNSYNSAVHMALIRLFKENGFLKRRVCGEYGWFENHFGEKDPAGSNSYYFIGSDEKVHMISIEFSTKSLNGKKRGSGKYIIDPSKDNKKVYTFDLTCGNSKLSAFAELVNSCLSAWDNHSINGYSETVKGIVRDIAVSEFLDMVPLDLDNTTIINRMKNNKDGIKNCMKILSN